MQSRREGFRLEWSEGVPTPREVPGGIFYDVELRLEHGADGDAVPAFRRAFQPLAGDSRIWSRPFFGTRLKWDSEKWPLTVVLRGTAARIRMGHRVKGDGLAKLISALEGVPGVRNLQVNARRLEVCADDDASGSCGSCH